MNETYVTVFGNVVEPPEHRITAKGTSVTKLRVASSPRWLRDGEWGDGPTSFYEISCWNKLGEHVASCVTKGDPVVVHGTLQVREWTNDNGTRGRSTEITADHLGHDLRWGTSIFRRGSRAAEPAPVHVVTEPTATGESESSAAA